MEKETYESFLKMTGIFQKAVKKAQQHHRDLGIPNVYSKNGRTIWELPNGEFTHTRPDDLLK